MRVWIAVSADGFVADPQGGVDWLAGWDSKDFGFEAFVAGIGALIHGRTTYDQVLGFGDWPYGARKTFVLTRGTPAPSSHLGGFGADPVKLLARARDAAAGKDIWLDGGARAIAAFRRAGLIDEFVALVLPVTLGAGLALFEGAAPPIRTREPAANGAHRTVYDLDG